MNSHGNGNGHRRKRHQNFGPDVDPTGSHSADSMFANVPFRDAHPDSDELPLHRIDNFEVPGRDENGGQQSITFSVPPYMLHQLRVAAKLDCFPYLDIEGLLRHAAVRHLRWLPTIRERVSRDISNSLDLVMESCRAAEMKAKIPQALDILREQIERCHSRGEHQEAMRLLGETRKFIDESESSAWKRVAQEMFADRFKTYLQGTVKVVGNGSGGTVEVEEQVEENEEIEMVPVPSIPVRPDPEDEHGGYIIQ